MGGRLFSPHTPFGRQRTLGCLALRHPAHLEKESLALRVGPTASDPPQSAPEQMWRVGQNHNAGVVETLVSITSMAYLIFELCDL